MYKKERAAIVQSVVVLLQLSQVSNGVQEYRVTSRFSLTLKLAIIMPRFVFARISLKRAWRSPLRTSKQRTSVPAGTSGKSMVHPLLVLICLRNRSWSHAILKRTNKSGKVVLGGSTRSNHGAGRVLWFYGSFVPSKNPTKEH